MNINPKRLKSVRGIILAILKIADYAKGYRHYSIANYAMGILLVAFQYNQEVKDYLSLEIETSDLEGDRMSEAYYDLLVVRMKREGKSSPSSICIPVPLIDEVKMYCLLKGGIKLVDRRVHDREINTSGSGNVSKCFEVLSELAEKLEVEGQDVRFFIKKEERAERGERFVTTGPSRRPVISFHFQKPPESDEVRNTKKVRRIAFTIGREVPVKGDQWVTIVNPGRNFGESFLLTGGMKGSIKIIKIDKEMLLCQYSTQELAGGTSCPNGALFFQSKKDFSIRVANANAKNACEEQRLWSPDELSPDIDEKYVKKLLDT